MAIWQAVKSWLAGIWPKEFWRGPVRWVLIPLVFVLVGAGVAIFAFGPSLGVTSTQDQLNAQVKATVVNSASCTDQNAQDTVEVRRNGTAQQIPLNGCGHSKGEALDVVVTTGDAGQPIAQLAAATQVAGNRDGRLTAILITLSALAGALYAFLIRGQDWSKLLARSQSG